MSSAARFITQILFGIMLLYGVITLLPKAYIEMKQRRFPSALLSLLLALLALFFACMAFVYAWLLVTHGTSPAQGFCAFAPVTV